MPTFKDKNFEQKPMLKLKSWFFNLYFILYVKIAPAETFTFNWSNCADNANELCEDDDMISSTHICFQFFGPLSQSHSANWVSSLISSTTLVCSFDSILLGITLTFLAFSSNLIPVTWQIHSISYIHHIHVKGWTNFPGAHRQPGKPNLYKA